MSVAELAESAELVDLTVAVDDRVAVLTLNRPESLNAFSGAMGRSLTAALRACDADDEVRVVVITGAGRAFCAGADFSGGAGVFGTPDSNDATANKKTSLLLRPARRFPSMGRSQTGYCSHQWPRRRDRPDHDIAMRHPHRRR